jgi:hypothetical protein
MFIFFQSQRVENCMKNVYKHNFVTIERWFKLWCKSILTLHLYIMNYILSLSKIKSIVMSWLWIFQVIVSDLSRSFNCTFVTTFNKALIAAWWKKHLLYFQCEWCKLKFLMTNYSQSFLISSFNQEIINESFMKKIEIKHEL